MPTIYTGIVARGAQRGTALGFPTANIALTDASVSGIYAAKVSVDSETFHAAAFADPKRNVLEAYMLDFSGNLYDKEITIELCEKIRESDMFADERELRAAIAKDVEDVRHYFKDHP